MEPMEWVQVLSYVRVDGNQKRSWPTAMVVLTRLAGWEDGGLLTGPDAAAMAGVSEAAGRRVLLALERMKVIIRDPGSKLKWCALNEDWRRWRVGWAIPPAAIEAQLAKAREERAQNVLERISARSKSGRSWDRIARSEGARLVIESALEEATIARSKGARMPGPGRAPMSARTERQARAAQERAQKRGRPQQQLTSDGLHDADNSTSVADGPPSQHQRMVDLSAGWVKAKLLKRCLAAPHKAVPFLGGSLQARFLDLCEHHGTNAVGAAVELIPAGELNPVFYIDALADLIGELTAGGLSLADQLTAEGRLGPRPSDEEATTMTEDFLHAGDNVERLKTEARDDPRAVLASIERQIQFYVDDDAEPPASLLDDLARWQDEVARGEGPEAIAR